MTRQETEQRAVSPVSARPAAAHTWGNSALAVFLLFGVIFTGYFASYGLRHLTLPAGFDPPYYIWRSQYLAHQGLGTGLTAARPGYPILSVILGAVTGRSQLALAPVLSLALLPVLAMTVGAFARSELGAGFWTWVVIVLIAGIVLGPTQLAGENLSNLLNLILVVAALIPLAGRVGGGRGFWAAVALLVASGLAHWYFLSVFGAVLGVAFVLALRSSLAERAAGEPLLRTECGVLAEVAFAVTAIMAGLIGALRAPFRTVEVTQDSLLYRRQFKTDVARLVVPGVAGLAGVPTVRWVSRRSGGIDLVSTRRGAFALRMLGAWVIVAAAGMLVGAITLRLPPARFLAMLVALPGALAAGLLVAFGAGWIRAHSRAGGASMRWANLAAVALALVAVTGLAVPGALRWYRYPALMQSAALQQAQTANTYVRTLPARTPVVFVAGYFGGRPGSYSAVVNERTIRIGLDPGRELDAHLFVGSPADLLAGRRTPPPDPRTGRLTLPYWEDVRTILPLRPPVVVLRAMGEQQFRQARALGGSEIAPGVVLLRGPRPARAIVTAPPPHAVPGLAGGVGLAILILVLLGVAGAGWTRLVLGANASPEVYLSLAPAVGAGALILGGLAAAALSVRLGGSGGVITYLVVAVTGGALGLTAARRKPVR